MSIEVTHYYGVHQGGTKDYHVYLFTGPNKDHALLVKRYGKTGTDGQMLYEVFPSHKAGHDAFDRMLKERSKKGYDMRRQAMSARERATPEEAIALLPLRHRSSFKNFELQKLVTATGSTVTGTHDPLAAERAKLVQQLQEEAERDRAAKAQQEALAEQQMLQSNPMFGMF